MSDARYFWLMSLVLLLMADNALSREGPWLALWWTVAGVVFLLRGVAASIRENKE